MKKIIGLVVLSMVVMGLAAGCGQVSGSGSVTYSGNIAGLCGTCHATKSYAVASSYNATTIQQITNMTLTADQLSTFTQWVNAGYPQ